MYIYTKQAMPGCKAKFDGDTSVKYQVRRTHATASAKDKSRTAVIRTGMGYTEATALIKIFNDKEGEARAIKKKADSRFAANA
jgi:ribosomal protein S24E